MAVMTGEITAKTWRVADVAIRVLATFFLTTVVAESLPAAGDTPARLLYVQRGNDKIIASNVLFSRSDKFRLSARESVAQQMTDNAVLVLATNRSLIGYSVYTAS